MTRQVRRAPAGERRDLFEPHQPVVIGDASQQMIRARINSATRDRYGTRILPAGMVITPGPLPLLFNHQLGSPCGRILQLERTADAVWIDAHVSDDQVWRSIRAGEITGTSIGFRPLRWSYDDEGEAEETLVCDQWELAEVSICSVPANPEARIEQIRSLGDRIEQEVFAMPFQPPARQREEPPAAAPRLIESIPASAPAIHAKRAQPFNVGRVWQAMIDGRQPDGLEGECVRELERRSDVPTRGMRLPAALFKRAISTDPGSIGAMSPTAYLGQLLDDMSAARKWGSLLPRMGFTIITTGRESVAIPKRDTRIQASWGPKDAPAVESEWSAKDDTLAPTYIKVTATLERSALKYGDPAALALTLNDIGDAMDEGADTGLLFGTGANDQPIGLLTQPGRNVDMAGAAVTSQNLMDFKNTFLRTWRMDAPDSSVRWLMRAESWDALRVTSKKQGGTDEWPSGIAPFDAAEMVLLQIGVIQSGKVEDGTPANCYPVRLVHGRMGVVVWFAGGSVDTIVDAMSLSTRGAVRVSAFLDCNCVIRDPQIVHRLANVLARPPAGGPLAAPPARVAK